MELQDKRVNKIIARQGFKPEQVFYNPRGILLLPLAYAAPVWGLLVYAGIPLIFWSALWLLFYGLLMYLVFAKRGNNFVLTGQDLVVINPNPPFRSLTVIALDTITGAVIDEEKKNRYGYIFFWSQGYYLELHRPGGKTRYYCAHLAPDAYDEGFTKHTLDDLGFALERKGVPTQFLCFDE